MNESTRERQGKGRFHYFRLLKIQNLVEEVRMYGYYFSWKSNLVSIFFTLFIMAMVVRLFHLKTVYFALVMLVVIMVYPAFVLNIYKQKYEQKCFTDAVTYAEQLLYSFQKSKKILSALKEVRVIFEAGKMRSVLEKAIDHIEQGDAQTESGVLREALTIIENNYDCNKIRMAHSLLLGSEAYGGELENSLYILLSDIEGWKRRGYKSQLTKKERHVDNIISVIVAMLLCVVALKALNAMGNMFPMKETVDVFLIEIIQVSSFLFVLFLIYVLMKSFKALTESWIKNETIYDTDYIVSCYKKIRQYDETVEKRKSMLAGVMLLPYKIGYAMALKDVKDELYMELPQWLMEIALLLQNNNVQVAIIKSIENASPLLQMELYQLVERLEIAPEDIVSYVQFCKRFDIPEAQSCMKMLHAISESGTGNSQVQINNLLKRVQEMQDMADNIQAKEQAFKMKMLFSYPVLGATAKLLVDLTIGMFYMFALIGSIGGM